MSVLIDALLSNEIAQRVGWALIHFLWQGAAVALLLAVTLWLLPKKRSRARWVVSCVALFVMALLPIVTACMVATHAQPVALEAVEPTPTTLEPTPLVEMAPAAPATFDPVASSVTTQPAEETAMPPSVVTSEPEPTLWQRVDAALANALPWVVLGWVVGVIVMSVWHVGGWLHVWRTARRGGVPVSDEIREVFERLLLRLGIRRPIRLLESARVAVPTVIGWLRPVILLPVSAMTGLSSAQIEAVLAHELGHIRRYDCFVKMIQAVVETILFYHPAVWWVSNCIRRESEHCCDELALTVCGNRQSYAQALATISERGRRGSGLVAAATGGKLLSRIRRIVGLPDRDSVGRSGWIGTIFIIAMILSFALIIAHPRNNGLRAEPADAEPETPPWGEAVEGVQARLQAHKARWERSELPSFQVAVRNQGNYDMDIAPSQVNCEIEFDGQWYMWSGTIRYTPVSLPRNAEQRNILVSLLDIWYLKKPGDSRRKTLERAQPLALKPGIHTVRVACQPEYPVPAGHQVVRVISNPAQIEIIPGTEPQPQPWGAAMDGVQVRLQADKTEWKAGEVPTLSLALRNCGKEAVDFVPVMQAHCEIEYDHEWYGWAEPIAIDSFVQMLKPGEDRLGAIRISLVDTWAAPKKGTLLKHAPGVAEAWGERLELTPGKHTVRVRFRADMHKTGTGAVTNPVELTIEPASVEEAEDTAWGEAVNGLQCRLLPKKQTSAPSTGTARDKVVCYVTFELRNVSDKPIRFLPTYSALEMPWSVFKVTGPKGREAPYRGWDSTPAAPTAASFIVVEPGQTLRRKCELHYGFTTLGHYNISTTPNVRADHALRCYYGGDTEKARQNPDNVWTGTLASNVAHIEIIEEEPAWGEAVEGVQVRLRADKTEWKAGEVPTLKADVRNRGKRDLTVCPVPDEIEFEGAWYEWWGDIDAPICAFRSGQQHDNIPITLSENWLSKIKRGVGVRIEIKPGKHTVRVAFTAQPNDGGKSVRAISNPVEITTLPASPSTADELVGAFKAAEYYWQQFDVAEKIVKLGKRRVIPEIEGYLDSEDRATRCNAGFVLAGLGDKRGRLAIISELMDKSSRPTTRTRSDGKPDIEGQIRQDRYYAAHVLGALGNRKALPPLIVQLTDEEIGYEAANALGEIGDKRAIPHLKEVLNHKDDMFQLCAATALAKLGDPIGLPKLTELLKGSRGRLAADALGSLGNPKAVPALIDVLDSDDVGVRVSAIQALRKLRDPRALPALEKLRNDTRRFKQKTVGANAKEAIASIKAQ